MLEICQTNRSSLFFFFLEFYFVNFVCKNWLATVEKAKQYKFVLKMSVRVIDDESHFQQELQAAGVRLVVVDFTASWYVNQICIYLELKRIKVSFFQNYCFVIYLGLFFY